jgi:hypothetical protein
MYSAQSAISMSLTGKRTCRSSSNMISDRPAQHCPGRLSRGLTRILL